MVVPFTVTVGSTKSSFCLHWSCVEFEFTITPPRAIFRCNQGYTCKRGCYYYIPCKYHRKFLLKCKKHVLTQQILKGPS